MAEWFAVFNVERSLEKLIKKWLCNYKLVGSNNKNVISSEL